jgi:hypothetical protein
MKVNSIRKPTSKMDAEELGRTKSVFKIGRNLEKPIKTGSSQDGDGQRPNPNKSPINPVYFHKDKENKEI